jgi:hypothetical protein
MRGGGGERDAGCAEEAGGEEERRLGGIVWFSSRSFLTGGHSILSPAVVIH